MKKIFTYALILTIVAILTISGTYALFTASVTGNQQISFDSHQVQVIYSGDTEISGFIELVENKEGGFRRVVSIALGEDSVGAAANFYIHLTQISEGLAAKALKWELYKINGEEETYIDSGTFEGYQSGEKVYMMRAHEITTEQEEYAVYLWLNGHEAGNEVIGASLMGYIGAESEPISGITTE